jgi:hypothetical protein
MKPLKFILPLILLSLIMSGQRTLQFLPVYGEQDVNWNRTSYSLGKEFITIEKLKMYISGIEFYNHDSLVWREADGFHLLDSEEPSSFNLHLSLPENVTATTVRFNIGIDSVTSVSGALAGPLDPAKGMYWAWHSGYINIKLEGTCSCIDSPTHQYQYHLGGYQMPYYALRSKGLDTGNKINVQLTIDLQQFLREALQVKDHIMSPGTEAVHLSEIFSDCFSISGKNED